MFAIVLTLTSNYRAHNGPRKTTQVSQTRLGSWVGSQEGRRASGRGQHRVALNTCGDPSVQVQPLHHNVVQKHSRQRHQDIGEAHVEHNGGPCTEEPQ